MTQSLAVVDRGVRSGAELVARVQRVREVMRDLMEEGVHYGKVPGTQKPSLWKPGAELLLMTFRIGPKLDVEDLSTLDEIRYRVTVTGIAQGSGECLGEAIGECSTSEEKYRWRGAVHPNEWEATPEDRRRQKWTRDGSTIAQVRTSPADQANTVLLMAVKRGLVAMTRIVTACSDIFDQDVEDLPSADAGVGATPAAASARKVERASAAKATAAGATTPPLKVGNVRVFGKDGNNYAILLVGDTLEYTTKDAALAAALEHVKGTEQLVTLTYETRDWQGKTYYNIKAFALVEPSAPDAPLTAGQIPFGDPR
jgi:hypothetical protein